MLIRKDMDVNEDEILSNITFRHKLKSRRGISKFELYYLIF